MVSWAYLQDTVHQSAESSCSCSLSIKIECWRKHNRFSVRSLSFYAFFFFPIKNTLMTTTERVEIHVLGTIHGGLFCCLSFCFLYLLGCKFKLKVAILSWDVWTHKTDICAR